MIGRCKNTDETLHLILNLRCLVVKFKWLQLYVFTVTCSHTFIMVNNYYINNNLCMYLYVYTVYENTHYLLWCYCFVNNTLINCLLVAFNQLFAKKFVFVNQRSFQNFQKIIRRVCFQKASTLFFKLLTKCFGKLLLYTN